MLSVLIPVYNRQVYSLVENIFHQLNKLKIQFEIIVVDDASPEFDQQDQVKSTHYCKFFLLEKNIGRSRVRNLLAQKARYKWLLFLDCDVIPVTSSFIEKYIQKCLTDTFDIVVGGVSYSKELSDNQIKFLRYKFGEKSEAILVKKRQKNPYKYLFTANFLIRKNIFQHMKFDEELLQYGYEDLLFAKELQQRKFHIIHIDNPVFHLGIDSNFCFIQKTKQALENLGELLHQKKLFYRDTKISLLYTKMNYFKILPFLSLFMSFFEKRALKKSSIISYQLFRLVYLHQVFKKIQ